LTIPLGDAASISNLWGNWFSDGDRRRNIGTTQGGLDKVTGAARYIDDITLSGMLYGATVRSQVPRGTIKAISFDPRLDWGSLSPSRRRIFPARTALR